VPRSSSVNSGRGKSSPGLSLAALRGTRLDPLRGLNLSRLSGNPA
jgi:hypothetical protein